MYEPFHAPSIIDPQHMLMEVNLKGEVTFVRTDEETAAILAEKFPTTHFFIAALTTKE